MSELRVEIDQGVLDKITEFVSYSDSVHGTQYGTTAGYAADALTRACNANCRIMDEEKINTALQDPEKLAALLG